jgi:hypothetical protein
MCSSDTKEDVRDEHEEDDEEPELLRPRDHRLCVDWPKEPGRRVRTASAKASAVKKNPPYCGDSL